MIATLVDALMWALLVVGTLGAGLVAGFILLAILTHRWRTRWRAPELRPLGTETPELLADDAVCPDVVEADDLVHARLGRVRRMRGRPS